MTPRVEHGGSVSTSLVFRWSLASTLAGDRDGARFDLLSGSPTRNNAGS
jgi:hypothetical protein